MKGRRSTDDRASAAWQLLRALDSRLGLVAAVGIAVCVLLGIEVVLQARHYLRTGENALHDAIAQPYFVLDPQTGLRLFRPSADVEIKGGTRAVTNSWGLRGEEVTPREPATRRVAVLGASTVFGMYARSNRDAPPALLEQTLRATGDQRVSVINAGVPALTSSDQLVLLEKRLLGAGVSDLFWYVGQNDIACPRASLKPWVDFRWLVTYQLAEQNIGAWVKDERDRATPALPGPEVDWPKIEANLRRGVRAARDAGVDITLVTVATLYDQSLPPELNRKFSEAARRSKPCMDVAALVAAKETLNAIIRRVAAEEHVRMIDAASHLSGRPSYFGDGTHLTVEGGRALANLMADTLLPGEAP